GSRVYVRGSTSTRTGWAPTYAMASTVAIKVLAAVMTSSPGPMPYARNAISRADVPESTPTAYFTSQYAANASSNRATSLPRMKSVRSSTLRIAWSSSSAIAARCAPRSTKGTCNSGLILMRSFPLLWLIPVQFNGLPSAQHREGSRLHNPDYFHTVLSPTEGN